MTDTKTTALDVPGKDDRRRIQREAGTPFEALLDSNLFEHMQRVAKMFASSSLVPEAFRAGPTEKQAQEAISNCYIALQMAMRCNCDPFMFLQNMYVIKGKPGIEAKLAIALTNASKTFSGPIRYHLEGEGRARKCVAYATDATTGDRIEETVTMEMAHAEGWYDRKDSRGQYCSKWRTLPDLMLQYRAAMFLIRLHCPEVIMGMQSREEVEDVEGPVTIDQGAPVRIADTRSLDALAEKLAPEADSAPDSDGDATPESSSADVSEPEGPGLDPSPDETPEPVGETHEAEPAIVEQYEIHLSEVHTLGEIERVVQRAGTDNRLTDLDHNKVRQMAGKRRREIREVTQKEAF